MKAIVVTDQAAGTAGMKLVEQPEPQGAALASLSGANYGDVVVQVHASGFTGNELARASTATYSARVPSRVQSVRPNTRCPTDSPVVP